jgi:hypothetical protein
MTENNDRQVQQPTVEPSTVEQRNGLVSGGIVAAEHAATDPAPTASSVERAEQIADRLGEKCAAVTSACVRKLAWLTARAREAAEDLWAEAQSVRRKDQP